MSQLEKIDLRALANAQPVDTDYPLAEIGQGALLLLNQRPQAYPWECHKVQERIVVIEGRTAIVTDDGQRVDAQAGEMIIVPAGLRHAYAEDSDGAVLVLFGGAAPQA